MSTNAVEIAQNMGVEGIVRIEEYFAAAMVDVIDPMLVVSFDGLDRDLPSQGYRARKSDGNSRYLGLQPTGGLSLKPRRSRPLNALAVSLGRP